MLIMSLGQFISRRRKYLKMTQEVLAKELSVSKSAVAKWETDGGVPDRDNLYKLADVLNVQIDEMYYLMEHEKKLNYPSKESITEEIIAVLESHGYKVIPPKEN